MSDPGRWLVTGGAGFIGTNFVLDTIANTDARVVVLDALTYAGNVASLEPVLDSPRFEFVHGDILDRELVDRLLAAHDIDTIVHFAAESHVDRSIHGPEAFIRTNVLGTHVLLEAARARWIGTAFPGDGREARFHHVSTDEVYGSLEPDAPPSMESDAYAPNSPYSASKAGSDHLVRAYHHTYGLPVTTSNCSNNFGPYQFPEKLIPLMITRALQGGALPVYGDGRHRRDWLYVEDHVHGIRLVLEGGRVGETYNFGGENEWANVDLVQLLCGIIDAAFERDPLLAERFPQAPPAGGGACADLVTFVDDRPGHDRRYSLNVGRAREELGYVPEPDIERPLDRTVLWYLDHEAWWRGVLDGSYREWLETNYGADMRGPG